MAYGRLHLLFCICFSGPKRFPLGSLRHHHFLLLFCIRLFLNMLKVLMSAADDDSFFSFLLAFRVVFFPSCLSTQFT